MTGDIAQESIMSPDAAGSAGQAPPTVSHLFGEMTWLLTQSPLHRNLAIGDLDWLIMPALLHEQFYIFRDADKPVGLALWAYCSPEAARKLDGGLVTPGNRLTFADWKSGDELWLVDLIGPFATADNHHRTLMISDLISGPLAGKKFRFHQRDAALGTTTVRVVDADAAQQLIEALRSAGEG